jgi:PadR family transcriptional regulator PadR
MRQPRSLSPAAEAVLAYLTSVGPSDWSYGYAIARQTQLKSGTLYPILARLADRGLLESTWEDRPDPGVPRRHLYRLTSTGTQVTTAAARPRHRAAVTRTVPLPEGA